MILIYNLERDIVLNQYLFFSLQDSFTIDISNIDTLCHITCGKLKQKGEFYMNGCNYKDKDDFLKEVNKRAELFINEFNKIAEENKDKLVDGVDRTPAQMIAYQLGWMNLILHWEKEEQDRK